MATGLNEKYFHKAGFDADKLAAAIAKYLPKIEPAYHPSVIQSANKLITRYGMDARLTNIRYMAYMLATASHEAREIIKFQNQ
jgi:hypothetical protein